MLTQQSILLPLDNGMRLAIVCRKNAAVDYFGVSVNIGSRDDPPHLAGLAHFVEHTIFKGTSLHPSSYIINRMEEVGGELNAFTSKEETVVYTIAPAGSLKRSVALLAELMSHSVFPADEIEREREVILDEIDSYLDTPSEAVFDDFEDLLFDGSPLGHNILGTAESVHRISSADATAYLKRRYVPGNMTVFYSGSASPATVELLCSQFFGHFHHVLPPSERRTPPVLPPFLEVREKGRHQAHTVMGMRIPGPTPESRYAWGLVTNILGGPGMNSMLNVDLREHHGLVYSAEASATMLSDCGMLEIYFGCDPEDVALCVFRVQKLLASLPAKLSPSRIRRAKRQFAGQLSIAADNAEARALGIGRALVLNGALPSLESTLRNLEELTPAQLHEVAETIATTQLSRLTLM